jgi:hypothetical protein
MPLLDDEKIKLEQYLSEINRKKTTQAVPMPDKGLKPEEQIKLKGYIDQIVQKTKEEESGVIREPTLWGKPAMQPLVPFKNALDIQRETAQSGIDLMKKAFQTGEGSPSLLGRASNLGLGALEYAWSPHIGAVRGLATQPIEGALTKGGMDKSKAETVGKLIDIGSAFALPGGIAKSVVNAKAGPGFKAASEMTSSAKRAFMFEPSVVTAKKKALPFKIKTAQKLTKETGNMGLLTHPQVKPEVTKEIVDMAKIALEGKELDKAKRISAHLSEWLRSGDIIPEHIPAILRSEKISPEQFATIMSDTISVAGKTLNHMSRLSKQLGFVFKKNPEAAKVFEELYKKHEVGLSVGEKVLDTFSHLEDIRRGLLVTQVATAVRNANSQAGRLVLAQIDESMQSAVTGGMKGLNLADETMGSVNMLNAVMSRMTKKGRADLERILSSDAGLKYKARLTGRSVHEVPAGEKAADNLNLARATIYSKKIVSFLNIPNRAQEIFFRKIAFEAKFKQLLEHSGMDFMKVDPGKIPKQYYEDALNYAFEMTFAANPKTSAGMDLLRAYKKMGFTTINPFPRFTFANAIPFILDHSPYGYLKALSPSSIKALRSGDPSLFAKAALRATLGSMMLKSAWHFRQSEYAGPKWYQIKLSEYEKNGKPMIRYIDVRPYAPFSMYFFMAEAMLHPEKMNTKDYAEAAVGLSRLSGTGLVFVDVLKSKSAEGTKGLLNAFVGAYIGSYTVPAKTAKDIVTAMPGQEEEGVVRDVRNNKEWGPLAPAISNIPYMSRQFPESVNPLTTEPLRTIDPLKRQFLGFTQSDRNAIQKEVDTLGIGMESVYPRTEVPEADRAISKMMARLLEATVPNALLKAPHYQHATEPEKRLMLRHTISLSRNAAINIYKKNNKEMAARIQYEKMSRDEQTVFLSKLPEDKKRMFEILLELQ